MNFIDLIWLFFIASALSPIIQRKMLESARMRLIRKIEKERKSRVIAMIHRQETMALLGFPIFKYIDIQDSEEVMRAIRMTDEAVPIDLVLHTPGGLVLAAEQIAYALKGHKAKVTVFVPHYAMSGGTLIALAADEIVMDPYAVLGPVDPQLGQYPAASILKVLEKKDINKIDDQTLIMADISHKALNQVKNCVITILSNKIPEEKAEQIADLLSRGQWTHDYPITYKQAQELGLPVSTKIPVEIYQLMNLYPQPVQRRPSVQYIPVPYKGGEERPNKSML